MSDSVQWVLETTFDLSQIGKEKEPKHIKPKTCWSKPEESVLKINVDACYLAESRQGSTGLVVRDREGRLIHGQALW
jgi:hypothetical protein